MKIKNLRIIPAIIIMIVIFVLSSIEIPFSPEDIPIIVYEVNYLLLLLHIGEFGLFSTTLMLAFYPQVKSYFLVIISILYGVLDEIHQYFVPTRFGDVLDILCDAIGAILGVLFYLTLLFIMKKIRTPKWVKKAMLDEVRFIEQFQKVLEEED